MSCLNATTLGGALDALAADPGALVLAGGTDLLVEINMGHRRPTSIVSVGRVPELRSWSHDPAAGAVRLGAAVTYAEVMKEPLATLMPALAQAARTVGSPQFRHTATVGGNVGTASPAGDGLPVLAALGATVHLASAAGTRDVPFAEFATGPKRTVRRPDELITAITVPVLHGWQGYSKVGVRNAMVIATATACLAVDEPAGSVRLALGSVGPVIIRAAAAEAFADATVDFADRRASADAVREFARLAAAAARPIDDHRSTAEYRRHAIGVLAGRLLRRAFPHE
jgi:CO/xanthine dehydrogenase FAD-binding subunit